jgi:hypothetical protein
LAIQDSQVHLESETGGASSLGDEGRHRAGSAWTDCGTQRHGAGGRAGWEAAVRCHRRAVELLGGLPIDGNPGYLADLGAAWVNLGCALQSEPSRDCLGDALDAFDRAIGFLGRLPIEISPRFRHNLAAARMNRADAFARLDTEKSRAQAIRDYLRTIDLARGLPLDEKASFRILLASSWINLGSLHQRWSDFPRAIGAYDAAVAALGNLPGSGHRLAVHHAATAWTNRGEALLCASGRANASRAVESARNALARLQGRDLGGAADAKLLLRALRVIARGLEACLNENISGHSADRVAELTDIAERGIDIALGSRASDPEVFDPFFMWFFSFGSRAYGRFQPQFLAEFLEEIIRRCAARAGAALEAEAREVARRAASGALEGLGGNRMIIAGARNTEAILGAVRELRDAGLHLIS